jgi:hypothetical protein
MRTSSVVIPLLSLSLASGSLASQQPQPSSRGPGGARGIHIQPGEACPPGTTEIRPRNCLGPEAPARVGVSVVDIATGMHAYEAILEALIARGRTGEGADIRVSMLDAMLEWMAIPMLYTEYGAPPRRVMTRTTEPIAFEPNSALCGPRTNSIRSTFSVVRCPKSYSPPNAFTGTSTTKTRVKLDTPPRGNTPVSAP